MKKNVGGIDRVLRLIIGVVLVIVGPLLFCGVWSWVLTIIGVVLLLTAAIGYCPPYAIFGISTCKVKTEPEPEPKAEPEPAEPAEAAEEPSEES